MCYLSSTPRDLQYVVEGATLKIPTGVRPYNTRGVETVFYILFYRITYVIMVLNICDVRGTYSTLYGKTKYKYRFEPPGVVQGTVWYIYIYQ
jgi:hypothetical protein